MAKKHSTEMQDTSIRLIIVIAFALFMITFISEHWWGLPGYLAIMAAGLMVLKKLDDSEA